MLAFVIKRLANAIFVMLSVSFLAFMIFRFVGDPVELMLNEQATQQQRDDLRVNLGLDDPFLVQFGKFVVRAAQGDFGISFRNQQDVIIGIASVAVSLAIGIVFGLLAGYYGKWVDNILMRIGDVLLSIPIILVAILVSSVAQAFLPPALREVGVAAVLVLAIAMYSWVQYARVVRAQTMVERRKEYVQAARLGGTPARRLMLGHILPNTLTPIFVAATLNFGLAILIEATLSFLGVGMPPNQPSLGTLIRVGNQYLFSGSWWIVFFPSLQLCILVVAVNMPGDWLRDALNPKLR